MSGGECGATTEMAEQYGNDSRLEHLWAMKVNGQSINNSIHRENNYLANTVEPRESYKTVQKQILFKRFLRFRNNGWMFTNKILLYLFRILHLVYQIRFHPAL